MKRIKIALIALFLGIVMVFGVAGCNAGAQNDLQKKIDHLQSRIEELEEQIEKQGEKIDMLDKELSEKSIGAFYSLQEAYDCGYLTKADLESIAHYVNEDLLNPEVLDSKIENAIKETAAYKMRNREIEPFQEAASDGFILVAFYGVYSDSYVIKMRNDYDNLPANVPNYWEEIGGVQFHFIGYDRITVWREKD